MGKHRRLRTTAIEPERKFIRIRLQMLFAHMMMRSVNAPFELAPEPFDILRMHVALRPLFRTMANRVVRVASGFQAVVRAVFVRVDLGRLFVRGNGQKALSRFGIGLADNEGSNTATPLKGGDYDGLACGTTAPLALTLAANVSFINLNRAGEGSQFLAHQFADLMAHAPSTLVSDTDLPLDFLGGDTVLRASHQEHDKEPRLERGRGLVEDRASGGADLMATDASVELPARNLVERVFPVALLALRKAVKAATENLVKTSIVGGTFRMEHRFRVPLNFDPELLPIHLHAHTFTKTPFDVKG